MTPAALAGVDRIGALLAARVEANERFFAGEADRLARLCHAMAERFARGGRLLAFGASAVDGSDARHVAVEFVHPVIVGKRALPALALPPAEVALIARAGRASAYDVGRRRRPHGGGRALLRRRGRADRPPLPPDG